MTKSNARKDRDGAENRMRMQAQLKEVEKVFFDKDTKLVVIEVQGKQYTFTAQALYELFGYRYTIRKGESYSARIAASILGRSVILRHKGPDGQYVPFQQMFGDGTIALVFL